MVQFFNGADFRLILPEVQLTLFALGILLTDFWLERREKYFNAVMALLGVAFSGLTLWGMPYRLVSFLERTKIGNFNLGRFAVPGLIRASSEAAKTTRPHLMDHTGSILIDPFFIFFASIFLIATALVILLSVRYLDMEDEQEGEYYALVLFATVGMMFMASGIDLIVQFIGLETMAISFYILAGFLRRDRRSNEGALKYLLLGAFSSGILAYGFSLMYGMSATTNIFGIAQGMARTGESGWLVFLAFATVAAGLFFKVAAVPFHQWAPDVYEGAPTSITAYLSVASKTASFALLLRLFTTAFWPSNANWTYLVAGVAVASLTLGNLAAITQSNIKRLLAYSSISHVGYVLLGIVAGNETGMRGISFYLFAYAFMNIGAFAIVIILRRKGLIGDELDDLNGLYYRSPGAAVLLLIFMLSLAGIPPTAGFIGKYYIFLALIQTGHTWLAVFAVLYIVPALYYYFRIVVHAWLRDPTDKVSIAISPMQTVALTATVLVTVVAGIYPEPFIRLAQYSVFLPFGALGR
ncbi:MAG TPA: NADH-quinone oxidoreductase subunit N [Candidatus Dormibacteraeota bacterium]|nr:NADH-quinone oxidoreductase subunit N [Candidatus Dormibacteraeota bacterium]